MTSQRECELTARQIPELHRAIPTGRREGLVVRTERDTMNNESVSSERFEILSAGDVVEDHRGVVTARGEEGSVMRKRE